MVLLLLIILYDKDMGSSNNYGPFRTILPVTLIYKRGAAAMQAPQLIGNYLSSSNSQETESLFPMNKIDEAPFHCILLRDKYR